MTSTVVCVAKIHITNGPDLEELLRSWLNEEAGLLPDQKPSSLLFEVGYFAKTNDKDAVSEFGTTYIPSLTGIVRLGGAASTISLHEYIITVESPLGRFEGQYNTSTRKGCLFPK